MVSTLLYKHTFYLLMMEFARTNCMSNDMIIKKAEKAEKAEKVFWNWFP